MGDEQVAPAEAALPRCLLVAHGVPVESPEKHFPHVGPRSKLLTCTARLLTFVHSRTANSRRKCTYETPCRPVQGKLPLLTGWGKADAVDGSVVAAGERGEVRHFGQAIGVEAHGPELRTACWHSSKIPRLAV